MTFKPNRTVLLRYTYYLLPITYYLTNERSLLKWVPFGLRRLLFGKILVVSGATDVYQLTNFSDSDVLITSS